MEREETGERYCYKRLLADKQFEIIVEIEYGRVSVDVIDCDTGEIYTLINVTGVDGAFVGRLRSEIETVYKQRPKKGAVLL